MFIVIRSVKNFLILIHFTKITFLYRILYALLSCLNQINKKISGCILIFYQVIIYVTKKLHSRIVYLDFVINSFNCWHKYSQNASSVDVIICLLSSDVPWLKIITLSSAYCAYVFKKPMSLLQIWKFSCLTKKGNDNYLGLDSHLLFLFFSLKFLSP